MVLIVLHVAQYGTIKLAINKGGGDARVQAPISEFVGIITCNMPSIILTARCKLEDNILFSYTKYSLHLIVFTEIQVEFRCGRFVIRVTQSCTLASHYTDGRAHSAHIRLST